MSNKKFIFLYAILKRTKIFNYKYHRKFGRPQPNRWEPKIIKPEQSKVQKINLLYF